MSRKLVVEVIGDTKSLEASLGRAGAATEGFRGKLEGVGKKMALFGAGVAVVGGELGAKFVEAGMSAQEQMGKLAAACEAQGLDFTKLKPAIDQAEASMRQLGFTNSDTRESLTLLIATGESMTKATKDMALAADLARFKDIDLGTATEALIKLHAGNTRALRDLGIVLPTVTRNVAELEQKHLNTATAAYKHAMAVAQLRDRLATAAEGVQILTSRVHGQADEFANSAEGGMAKFRAQLGNLQESLGTILLPIVEKASSALSSLVGVFQSLPGPVQDVIAIGGLAAVGLGALSMVIGGAIEVAETLTGAVGGLSAAMDFLAANPLVLAAAALVALGVALYEAWEHSATFRRIVEDSFRAVEDVARKVAKFVTRTIPEAFEHVLDWVRGNWPIIATLIAGPFAPIVALATNAFGVRSALVSAFDAVKSKTSQFVGDVVAFFRALPGRIVSALGDLSRLLWNAGSAIIAGLWAGAEAEFEKFKKWVEGIAGWISSHKGPLTADLVLLEPHGRALMLGLATGMQEMLPTVTALAGTVAPSISATVASAPTLPASYGAAGRGGAVPVNITVTVPNGFVGSPQELGDAIAVAVTRSAFAGHPLWRQVVRQAM